jgi:hypothetical protein
VPGTAVLSDTVLKNQPGRRWGLVQLLKTWRSIRFWKIYFSFNSKTHAKKFFMGNLWVSSHTDIGC